MAFMFAIAQALPLHGGAASRPFVGALRGRRCLYCAAAYRQAPRSVPCCCRQSVGAGRGGFGTRPSQSGASMPTTVPEILRAGAEDLRRRGGLRSPCRPGSQSHRELSDLRARACAKPHGRRCRWSGTDDADGAGGCQAGGPSKGQVGSAHPHDGVAWDFAQPRGRILLRDVGRARTRNPVSATSSVPGERFPAARHSAPRRRG